VPVLCIDALSMITIWLQVSETTDLSSDINMTTSAIYLDARLSLSLIAIPIPISGIGATNIRSHA